MKYQILLFAVAFGLFSNATLDIAHAQDSTKSPPAKIEDVAWISGHWQGEAMGAKFEETWNPPMAGTMMGMFKFTKDDGIGIYEFFAIMPIDNSLTLRLKHFDAEFIGWEEKDKSVEFPLVKITDTEAQFDGLVFQKINPDEMNILVTIDQGEGAQEIKFACKRVRSKQNHSEEIRQILKLDELISHQRNEATRNIPLSDAIRSYVTGLDAIDFSRCPDDVAAAFKKHRDAWQNSIEFFDSFSELRGELHELLDQIRESGETAASNLETHFNRIMETWDELESTNKKHGVE